MRIGSLFSGAGGLDMAVEAVFGGEVIWQCEMDKAASKVLAYRYPCAPNLGDITAVDWSMVETPDVLCGGFPCQDVSAAGKRAGIKDGTRSGLWSVFADIIDILRPPIVIIENVRGLLSAKAHRNLEPDPATLGDGTDGPVLRAAGAVLGDLADLGYDAQWTTVAAGDVGAPHRRERVFILAADSKYLGSRRKEDDARGRESDAARRCGRCQSEGCGTPFSSGPSAENVELLPTPCVVDRLATGEMTLDEWDESRRSQKERGVGSFGPRGDSLGAAILRVEEGTERPDYSTTKARRGGDQPGITLLPTPAAGNFNDGEDAQQWLARQETLPQGFGMPLSIAVQLLPTPNAQDGNGGKAPRGGRDRHDTGTKRQVPLTDLPDLLPTPNASDASGGGQHPDKRTGHSRQLIDYALLCTPAASDGAGGKTPRSGGRIDEPLLGGQAREMATAWGKYEPAIRRWESLTRPAPAPTEPNKNGNPRLSAAFSEWLMGWPDGWVTDPDISISRNDQLRIVGNGVCPQQAAAALRYLLSVCEVAA